MSHYWAGKTSNEVLAHYKNLKSLGIQDKSFYLLNFSPYERNQTASIELINSKSLPYLATEVSFPILQADIESKKIGHFNSNYIAGQQTSEITLTMIETQKNSILRSITALKALTFNNDGTYNLASEYAFWVEIWLYSRARGAQYPTFKEKYLCAVTQATLDMESSSRDALTIPITLTQLRPFMF